MIETIKFIMLGAKSNKIRLLEKKPFPWGRKGLFSFYFRKNIYKYCLYRMEVAFDEDEARKNAEQWFDSVAEQWFDSVGVFHDQGN